MLGEQTLVKVGEAENARIESEGDLDTMIVPVVILMYI